MNKFTSTTVAALFALALFASAAFPALAETNAYGSVNNSANVESGAGTNVSQRTGVDAVVNSGLGAGVKGVVNAIIGAGSATGSANSTPSASDSSGAESGGSATVRKDSSIIIMTRGNAEVLVDAHAVAATEVHGDADLSGFVASTINADENVARVETSADKVSVTYKQNAKLFGFIPVTLDATATVDAEGTMDVKYPWYAFLAVTNEADLEADLQSRVDSVFALGANAEASAELGASTQAHLINEIRAVMAAGLDADASASARVNKIDSFTVKQ